MYRGPASLHFPLAHEGLAEQEREQEQEHDLPLSFDAGHDLVRPQSAAPTFTGAGARFHSNTNTNTNSNHSHGPPGFVGSSASSTSSGGTLEGGVSKSDSSSLSFRMDQNAIMQAGTRRPSSTGVIGQHQPHQQFSSFHSASSLTLETLGLIPRRESTGGGLDGLNSNSVMDLIQEDVPKTLSPTYDDQMPSQHQHQAQLHPQAHLRPVVQQHTHHHHHQQHQQQQHQQQQQQHQYTDREDNRYHSTNETYRPERYQDNNAPMNGLSNAMGDLRFSQDRGAVSGSRGAPYMPVPVSQLHGGQGPTSAHPDMGGMEQNMYMPHHSGHPGTVPPTPHGVHSHHQNPYEGAAAQTMYYNNPQPQRAGTGTAGGGAHGPYGYATIPYHAPHQQHANRGGGGPRHDVYHPGAGAGQTYPQEYISVPVMPMQGGPPSSQMQHVYWNHPQGEISAPPEPHAGVSQTITVVTAHTQGVATRGGNTNSNNSNTNNNNMSAANAGGRQGRGKAGASGRRSPIEKGTKGRRAGGGGRRGDQKHSLTDSGPVSSSLLDQFKAAKNRIWTMTDIKGHIVEFCQDQNGSRFIQQRLEVANTPEKTMVMNEVLPAVRRLRNDVFGNYVVQKLIEHGTKSMQDELRETLKGELLPLSLQMYGCRVVQKAFETLPDEDLTALLKEFHHNVISCIHDQNGNHVMQKCIEVMSSKAKAAHDSGDKKKAKALRDEIQFIVDDVLDNVASLSCHPYGCRVLQRILEHTAEPQKTRALNEINNCHRLLLDDQYGNYVIQHVLQFGRNLDRESILALIYENGLLILSRQKFASNVVEKLLQYGSPEQRNAIVREMLKFVDETTGVGLLKENGGSSVVLLMVRDAYANYVVQTTLDVVAEGEEKRRLLEELNANSELLRNYTFAKHIVTKLGA